MATPPTAQSLDATLTSPTGPDQAQSAQPLRQRAPSPPATTTSTQTAPDNSTTGPLLPTTVSNGAVHGRKNFNWEKFKRIASPSMHDVLDANQMSSIATQRHYSYRKQRWRLVRLSVGEWLLTVVLCLAIFGALYGYSKWHTLDPRQKRASLLTDAVFNAVLTGLSVALGLNLTSSLRSYAKMLRWRLLAGRYRPLSQFELLLGIERQTNVIKLFFSEFSNKRRRRRWFFSGTQFWCLLWILINLAATVLVSMIGLTYNLDQSSTYILTQPGLVSVVDFSYLTSGSNETGFYQAFFWGYTAYGGSSPIPSLAEDSQTHDGYESVGGGLSRYWFIDYNANRDPDEDVQTSRYVDAQAYCQAFDVVSGAGGNNPVIQYQDGNQRVTVKIYEDYVPGPGGMLFISDRKSNCGDRCASVSAFQAESAADDQEGSIMKAQYFICNNTMSEVQRVYLENPSTLSNLQARMLAGAIGWSGISTPGDSREFEVYDEDYVAQVMARGSPLVAFTAQQIADIVAQFSIAAVAEADDLENGRRKTIHGETPVYADYLKVTWWHTGPLLIVIPCIHLLTLIAVIAWANRAIIKDDTILSSAKLYNPIIQQLGDHGCIMRGDQIINKLRDPVVTYGFSDTTTPGLKHVGIFVENSGVKIARAFEEGDYDGSGDKPVRPAKLKVD